MRPVCHVCHAPFQPEQLRGFASVRPGVGAAIEAVAPGWAPGAKICTDDLRAARSRHVAALLQAERGTLSALDHEVIESLARGETITQPPSDTAEEIATFGERMADAVARFGGSWGFILSFAVILMVWMAVNASQLLTDPFDPYPFILLNLVLSSLAALQAPIIMMSQRRQDTRDRLQSENDYRVNLKAELEIRQLHDKIDHQLAHQWERLADLQQIQIDLLEEAAGVRRE